MDCLDEDLVLAFVDGALDEVGRGGVEGHLGDCRSCSDLVAAAAGGDPARWADAFHRQEPPPIGLARGAAVGRYVILDLVGRGGMGEVYGAYDPQLDRKVALKLLHETGLRGSPTARERLLREAKAIARLSHPNVIVVHDAGTMADLAHGDRVFLAMEFIEGETLSTWRASAPRSWQTIRDVFVAAGQGLAAAHGAGLVHRDFKPQNVMVGHDGSVRVMDFGLASDAGGGQTAAGPLLRLDDLDRAPTSETIALTGSGVLLGTPLYMAPEQLEARPTDARTDQFSFCVALYEALYGERPFPSESFSVLFEAVIAGRVRPAPQKARVPAFLRKLLLRGLDPDPAARFASMEVLLEALGHNPIRRRRASLIAVAMVAVALGGVVGMQRLAGRGERICRGAGDKLAGIWEPKTTGERRAAIHRSFLATGLGFAEETWGRVASGLDAYSRRWTELYTDACEATHVRGDQSAEVLDLRMACLEGPRGALRALTDVLSRADSAVLVHAVNAVETLPPLERCSDVVALRAVVPPPADAATRARVAAVETHFAEAKALSDTGQWPDARQAMVRVLGEARAVGYEPLIAESLAIQGWLEDALGEPATAAKTLEQSVWSGLAANLDELALKSATVLMGMNGYFLNQPEESERWERLAEALRRRLGPGHEQAVAWFYQDRAVRRERRGDYRAALADLDLALSLKRKALPPTSPDIAITLLTIANVRNDGDEHAAALVVADQAVESFRRAYGPSSPQLAQPLGMRGECFEFLGRYAEAERDLRAASELSEQWVGRDHPWTAIQLTALGKTLLAERRAREAVPILERALRIRVRSERNLDMVAEAQFALARARWEVGTDRAAALALAASALDGYRKAPGQARYAAQVEAWLVDKGADRQGG
jgi:eukaryotic-like serine/threonine-protein kinase